MHNIEYESVSVTSKYTMMYYMNNIIEQFLNYLEIVYNNKTWEYEHKSIFFEVKIIH